MIKNNFYRFKYFLSDIHPINSIKRNLFLWLLRKTKEPYEQSLSIALEEQKYFENYTKRGLIKKLVNMSILSRRDGYSILDEVIKGDSSLLFQQMYFGNFDYEKYLEDTKTKLNLFIDGIVKFLKDYDSLEVFNVSNVYKESLEEYSLEDIKQKVMFYSFIMKTEGILAAERPLEKEIRIFYRVLEDLVSGVEPFEIEERARLEILCKLNQLKDLVWITEIGLKSIKEGRNPRMLEYYLFSFVEEAERESLFN